MLHDGESLEKSFFIGWKHYQSYEEMGKRQPGSGLDQKTFQNLYKNIWRKDPRKIFVNKYQSDTNILVIFI